MKKLTVLILTVLMTLSLTACGGVSEDAVRYEAYAISMLGITLEPEEISESDIILALDENGKAEFTMDGEIYNCEWKVDDEVFTLSQSGDEFTGTMVGDVVTIVNMVDSGMDISFLKEGAEMPVDTSNPMGKYLLSGMDMSGLKMVYADIKTAEMDMELEFAENGAATICSYGEELELPIDYEAKTIDIDGSIYEYVFEDEQIILTAEIEGMSMSMTFTAENSEKWVELEAEESSIENGFTEPEPQNSDFSAPGYGAEVTVPVEIIPNSSDWYGTMTISNYEGPYADLMEGEHEARAVINNDGTQDYFELYVDGIYEDDNVVMSFYIDLWGQSFTHMTDENSWIFDATLTEDSDVWSTASLVNGVLMGSGEYEYEYDGEEESFVFEYDLAMIEGSDVVTE